jgi:hypothetical protein
MSKNKTYYIISLLFLIFFISLIAYGSILRHHFTGGQKFKSIQKLSLFLAEIPSNIKKLFISGNLNQLPELTKHKGKKKLENFTPSKTRKELLVLPRYDHNLSRSVVDVIDLGNFKVIHTYKHDIDQMNEQIKNKELFPRIDIDNSETRFLYWHPYILDDGSLLSMYGNLFKINFCSKLVFVNDKKIFHHSIERDSDNNYWVGTRETNLESKYIKQFNLKDFVDNSISKISTDNKILYSKSVIEILIENKLVPENYPLSQYLIGKEKKPLEEVDPTHLNDIEPALTDTKFWDKGDLFLSLRELSAIVHYRPSTNQVINYITGPFSRQHDVDIISNHEISIFNNNSFPTKDKYSEIVVYNFRDKTFRKLHEKKLKKLNFKTHSNGLSHHFKDGSLLVEETIHGRIIKFNNKGKIDFEYINTNDNNKIGWISWSRVIEDEVLIDNFYSLLKNKKCLN